MTPTTDRIFKEAINTKDVRTLEQYLWKEKKNTPFRAHFGKMTKTKLGDTDEQMRITLKRWAESKGQ